MATFHVDYINGSNSNDGSAANPYATMKYALETNSMGTGDDLKVAGSALTTQDSAATYSDAVGYNKLTTSIDLSTTISVGDVLQINPPSQNTEYQDWVLAIVTAISATEITFYEELHLPGTAPTGNWTIKTIDSVYSNTSGTMEEWADATVGANVSIIGGYDSTFTNVIGLTYFRRGGLGAGSTSGTCIKAKFANNNLNVAEFKNFQMMQWNESIRTEFGGSIYGDNLRAYTATSTNVIFGYFGIVMGKNNITPTVYYINCKGVTGNYSYASNAANDNTIAIDQNAKVFSSHNTINLSTNIKDLTCWNPGQNANGADFGATYATQIQSSAQISGAITFNVIDNARSGFRKGLNLFGQMNGTLTAVPTSITIIDGGLATAYWDFSDSQASKVSAFISSIMLPTGFLLKDQAIRGGRDTATGIQPNVQVVDADGTWLKSNGSYVSASSDHDTGDSSKLFFLGNSNSYATDSSLVQIFQFTKGASTPASITYRAKVDANGSGTSNVTIYSNIISITKAFADIQSANIASSTYTDVTANFVTGPTWDQIPVGAPVQIGAQLISSRNQLLYIDAITVNY